MLSVFAMEILINDYCIQNIMLGLLLNIINLYIIHDIFQKLKSNNLLEKFKYLNCNGLLFLIYYTDLHFKTFNNDFMNLNSP